MSLPDAPETGRPRPPWGADRLFPVLGPALIVASVAAGLASGFSSLGVAVVSAVVAGGVAVWGWGRERSSAEQVEALTRESGRTLRAWRDRWERLHAETRQNAAVLLQMTDGVIVLAPDRSILLVNPSSRRLLGIAAKDKLLGRGFHEVVRIPEIVKAVRDAADRRRPQEVTVELSDGGVVRPLRVSVDRIEMAEASNLLLTIRDETEARRVEEIRREFVANVSHELKTPLAAIKGYAETVEMAIEDDPQAAAHFMKQIQTECVRLERLVADMMQLARAQAGRTNLRMAELALGAIVAESIKSYHPVAERKRIELTVVDPTEEATVIADREATLTIVNNLIGNAIRYTPEGGHVRVEIRAEREHWALIVSDDGIGIAASEQERIFERFYRVEKGGESSRGGTGLGLSIVKNLTQAQGGDVKLRSVPGRGSTFEVWLPGPAIVPAPAGESV